MPAAASSAPAINPLVNRLITLSFPSCGGDSTRHTTSLRKERPGGLVRHASAGIAGGQTWYGWQRGVRGSPVIADSPVHLRCSHLRRGRNIRWRAAAHAATARGSLAELHQRTIWPAPRTPTVS